MPDEIELAIVKAEKAAGRPLTGKEVDAIVATFTGDEPLPDDDEIVVILNPVIQDS